MACRRYSFGAAQISWQSWPTKEQLLQATCEIQRNWTGGRIGNCLTIDTAQLANGRGAYPDDVLPGHTSLGVLRRLWNRSRLRQSLATIVHADGIYWTMLVVELACA
jgi:hypothetical protein